MRACVHQRRATLEIISRYFLFSKVVQYMKELETLLPVDTMKIPYTYRMMKFVYKLVFSIIVFSMIHLTLQVKQLYPNIISVRIHTYVFFSVFDYLNDTRQQDTILAQNIYTYLHKNCLCTTAQTLYTTAAVQVYYIYDINS